MWFSSSSRSHARASQKSSRRRAIPILRRAAYDVEELENRLLFDAELTLTKTGLPTPIVDAGGFMTYQITVNNVGTDFAPNVVITDTYSTSATPNLATFFSARQLGGAGPFTLNLPAFGSTGPISFSIGQLNSNVGAVFEVVLRVSNAAADNSTVSNTATVVRDINPNPSDPDNGDNPGDNTQTVITTVARRADIQVSKVLQPVVGAPAPVVAQNVVAGLDATYLITIQNNGSSPADNVLVSDIVPTFTTFISFVQVPNAGDPTFVIAPNPAFPLPPVGQQGFAQAGITTLAPGASAQFLLTVHVGSNTPDAAQVFNTVSGSTSTLDPVMGNNQFTEVADVQIMTDIQVTSSPNKLVKAIEGTFFPYTFSIINKGPSDAQGVTWTWETPNFSTQPLFPTELGVYWDPTGVAPAIVQLISGPAFTVTIPNPPPSGIGPRGVFTGGLATLPTGVGSTYQFYVGTPQQQDVIQKSSGGTGSPDVDMSNNTYVDTHHIFDAPLIVQTAPNVQANATQGVSVEVMTFIDTNAWPGNIVTPTYPVPTGRFFEMFDFVASVNWGDGQTSAGLISTDGFGVYHVTAQHVYNTAGAYPVHTLVTGDGESTAIGDAVALVGNAIRGGAQVGGLKFTENVTETKQVGVFAKGNAAPGTTFGATIAWGDGTPNSVGTVVINAFGTYTISGTHNYANEGTYAGSITVIGSDGINNTFPMTVGVDDRAVDAVPVNVTATAGIPANGVVVATFTDPGGPDPVNTYIVNIDWGDGLGASNGTVTYNAGTGVFTVRGNHTFANSGLFTMTVTISHGTAPNAVVQPVAMVGTGPAFPAVIATAGPSIAATTNVPITATVATFTDVGGGTDIPANYTAVINWGDGTPTTNGVITLGAGGVYTVTGTHTWVNANAYVVSVTITHLNSPPVTVNLAAVVALGGPGGGGGTGAILTVTPATIGGVEGTTLTGRVVGSFTAAATAVVTDFIARINWGDGTAVSNGTIVRVGAGMFQVKGTHTYKNDGTFPVVVTVTPTGQAASVINSTAIITDAVLRGISILTSATRNVSFTKVIGAFIDGNAFDMVQTNAGEYTVKINWGDGTAITNGTLIFNATAKRWDVRGTHTYTKAAPVGGFKPTITITDGTSSVKIISTITGP